MKILYVHGYGSQANNSTSLLIQEVRKDDEVIAPAIPYADPELSVRTIDGLIEEHKPDVLMGSSLGAFYLLQFDRGIPRILINPALPENLTNIGGRKEFVSALEKQFENVKDVSRGPAVIYCGEDDDVAPNFGYFSGRYNNDKSNVRVLSVPRMNHHLSRDAMLGPIDGDLSRLKQHCSANPRGTNLK